MANIFSFRRNDPPDDQVSISDLGTEALLNVLLLAASALAETESQKRLAVWLAEHDCKTGRANLGFCIANMPWDAATFDEDKRFMVRVTDAASQRTGWEKLGYYPKAQHLMPMLGWFRKCFMRLKAEDTDPKYLEAWLANMDDDDPVLNGFPRCRRHGIYLTWLGCQICNN